MFFVLEIVSLQKYSMPARKYQDLAHLSPEEYRKEADRRRDAERSEYHRQRYQLNKDNPDKIAKKISGQIEKAKMKIQALEDKKTQFATVV